MWLKVTIFCLALIVFTGCDKWERLSCKLISSDQNPASEIEFGAAIFNNAKLTFYVRSDGGVEILNKKITLENPVGEIIVISESSSDYDLKLNHTSENESYVALTSRDLIEWFLDYDRGGLVTISIQQGERILTQRYRVTKM